MTTPGNASGMWHFVRRTWENAERVFAWAILAVLDKVAEICRYFLVPLSLELWTLCWTLTRFLPMTVVPSFLRLSSMVCKQALACSALAVRSCIHVTACFEVEARAALGTDIFHFVHHSCQYVRLVILVCCNFFYVVVYSVGECFEKEVISLVRGSYRRPCFFSVSAAKQLFLCVKDCTRTGVAFLYSVLTPCTRGVAHLVTSCSVIFGVYSGGSGVALLEGVHFVWIKLSGVVCDVASRLGVNCGKKCALQGHRPWLGRIGKAFLCFLAACTHSLCRVCRLFFISPSSLVWCKVMSFKIWIRRVLAILFLVSILSLVACYWFTKLASTSSPQLVSHVFRQRNNSHTEPKKKKHWEGKEVVDEKSTLKKLESLNMRDVISLLGDDHVHGGDTIRLVTTQLLETQIRILRQAMLDEESALPPLTQDPSCVGNLKKGEVEDVLCIPKPSYLRQVKNPCWYAKDSHGSSSLQCLPYFHILGCAKAGTTDLWNRLQSHPHIVANDGLLHKEALWWAWRRYGLLSHKRTKASRFQEYINLFQDTARLVDKSLLQQGNSHKLLITGDASPPDFWDFRGWRNISQNRDSNIPQVITPHLMKHFYPKPKFILLFRDPIERLYSDYFFTGGGFTPQDFHTDLLAAIDILSACVKLKGLQKCFHDNTVYQKLQVRLTFACYSVHMREWLKVFPLESFLFLKTEEYEQDPVSTIKEVFKFLDLQELESAKLHKIAGEEKARMTQTRHLAGPMLEKSRYILQQLLNPCSERLVEMTGKKNLRWGNLSVSASIEQ